MHVKAGGFLDSVKAVTCMDIDHSGSRLLTGELTKVINSHACEGSDLHGQRPQRQQAAHR